MVSSELVKPALCFVVLMVSFSKCEIDSSAAAAKLQPSPSPPPEASSSDGTVKASHSFSSSSSSSVSSSGVQPYAVLGLTSSNDVLRRTSIEHQNGQQQSQSRHNNTSIISSSTTITPSSFAVASPILTSLQAPKQEVVVGRAREEGVVAAAAQEQRQQQHHHHHHHQFQSNNNNNKQGGSSFFTSSIEREKTTATTTSIPLPSIPVQTAAAPEEKEPSTTFSRNSARRFSFSSSSSPLLPARQILGAVIPRDNGQEDELISTNLDRSPIPRHTWIPAGLTFSCKNRVPGYYADASEIAKCQVYHMCMTDGRKYSMLCGIGTVFNQLTFVCDHWYNYRCADAEGDYKINSQLWEDFIGDDEEDDDDGQNDDDTLADDNAHAHQPSTTNRSFFQSSGHLSETSRLS